MIERALTVSGFALVEVVSNCHVLYGKMNNMSEASTMIEAMDSDTQRTNPTLLRRGDMPIRITSMKSPSTQIDPPTSEDISPESRTLRGVMFERSGSVDLSRRYYDMLDKIKAERAEKELLHG